MQILQCIADLPLVMAHVLSSTDVCLGVCVCVCMCMCLWVCMRLCGVCVLCVCVCVCVRARARKQVFRRVPSDRPCTHVQINLCLLMPAGLCMYALMCQRTACTCTHVCVYIILFSSSILLRPVLPVAHFIVDYFFPRGLFYHSRLYRGPIYRSHFYCAPLYLQFF